MTDGAERTTAAGESYTAAVIGASGYAGGELCRLVAAHPAMELTAVTSREFAGRSLGTVHPNLRDLELRFTEPEPTPTADVLFAATPHGVSMDHVDRYRAAASLVVDLSADFRLPVEAYEAYYETHAAPGHVADAAYGLAELGREQLTDAELIAVGGCNATAVLLALAPLVAARRCPERRETARCRVPARTARWPVRTRHSRPETRERRGRARRPRR